MSQKAQQTRPQLTASTKIEDFKDFYWLKSELQTFCREHRLPTNGSKQELERRIEHFLQSGEVLKTQQPRSKESAAARLINNQSASSFSLTTQAPQGFRCTQEARQFFEKILGKKFTFTVQIQTFIKENPGVTFAEIAEEWKRNEEVKVAVVRKKPISSQFEYNQFTRDFFSDPANKDKSRHDCIQAWKKVRAARGDNKYRRS